MQYERGSERAYDEAPEEAAKDAIIVDRERVKIDFAKEADHLPSVDTVKSQIADTVAAKTKVRAAPGSATAPWASKHAGQKSAVKAASPCMTTPPPGCTPEDQTRA